MFEKEEVEEVVPVFEKEEVKEVVPVFEKEEVKEVVPVPIPLSASFMTKSSLEEGACRGS